MSKVNEESEKHLSPKRAAKRVESAHLVEDENEEQGWVPKAPGMTPDTLKSPASGAAPEKPAAPEPTPSKPLAPLSSLWPSPAASQGEGTSSQQQAPRETRAPASSAIATASPTLTKAPKVVKVSFALHNPHAKRVCLCGQFNNWSPNATPMKRREDGRWETTLSLPPGKYQYKFLVDGEWLADPAAQTSVPNEFGSMNSVVEVQS